MILLYLELRNQRVEVYQLNLPLISAQHTNQVMIVRTVLHQRVIAFYVGLYHQLKIYCLYSPQLPQRVLIGQLHKALVSEAGVVVRTDEKETDVASLFSHDHDRVDRGEGYPYDLTFKHEHSFEG